jgi:tripartite-type tricarboxylate transporter receptor subunit TctC
MVSMACLVTWTGAAAQPAYPTKPIRLITPYPPGGSTTLVARIIGPKLTESWGQNVLVDNRPGGNTIIGASTVARAAPDGYTIMLMATAHVIVAQLLPAPYHPIKDFAPVATLDSAEQMLVINPALAANNLQELIALARSRPGQLNYASSGTAGATHLAAELFNIVAGVKTTHVPYKGSGQVIPDLIGGHVQMHFNAPISLLPHAKSGKLRGIAISGHTRLTALPEMPTFDEAGLKGFEVAFWHGILAPAGTPKAIVQKLSGEIAKVLAMPDIKEKLVSQGLDPMISTPDQFAALMKSDMAKYAKIIKSANIKLEN